jgi:hypothetical protein
MLMQSITDMPAKGISTFRVNSVLGYCPFVICSIIIQISNFHMIFKYDTFPLKPRFITKIKLNVSICTLIYTNRRLHLYFAMLFNWYNRLGVKFICIFFFCYVCYALSALLFS